MYKQTYGQQDLKFFSTELYSNINICSDAHTCTYGKIKKYINHGYNLVVPYNEGVVAVRCGEQSKRVGVNCSNDISIVISVPAVVVMFECCERCMVLRYALLCCVMLCCVVLYCVVQCSVVLYCIVLCCVMLYCAVLWCVVLCCVVLCCFRVTFEGKKSYALEQKNLKKKLQ